MPLSSSSSPMAEPDTVVTPSHHKQFSKVGRSPSSPTRQNPCKFVTRAAFFVAFAALLPLFPSQAPEFVTQTLLTRGWELLHLLLVGVAVSYGLFSRRNADPAVEKEALLHKAAESPQSYLTQLLQVSPVFDDDETPEIQSGAEGGKLQMWNSRCHREEPTAMVAGGISGGGGGERPLLLPVRSLRSRFPYTESPPVGKSEGPEAHAVTGVQSRALLRGGAEEGKVGEVFSVDPLAQLGDRVVLPSPIPWRSRSGRMEVKDEIIGAAKQTAASGFRSAPFPSQPSRTSSAASSPRGVLPSPPLSPERRAKSGEDSVKKKTLYKPPPPPPPPTFSYKPPILPSNDRTSERSFQDELQGGRDDGGRNSDVGSPWSSRLRTGSGNYAESYSPGCSVRTVRAKEELPDSAAEVGATTRPDSNSFLAAAATATCGISPLPVAPASVHQTQKNNGYVDEVIVASDGSDSSDDADEDSGVGELPCAARADAEENEVDKKADEFIAKFREQIRLQRIESIKTSAGQRGLRIPGK